MPTTTASDKIREGMRAISAEYYAEIMSVAQELKGCIESGEIADREALMDRVHDDCDGSSWIIYTFHAQIVLLSSDNADAGPDSLGADGFDWSGGVPWSQLAYFAMEADLYEALDSLGIDVNADDLGCEARGGAS